MAEEIEHKRGDTYRIDVVLTESDGSTPIDMTGWTVRSHVRRYKTLISNLNVIYDDRINGEFTLSIDDTTDWPICKLSSDIEYTDENDDVRSSETYTISVIGDITYD